MLKFLQFARDHLLFKIFGSWNAGDQSVTRAVLYGVHILLNRHFRQPDILGGANTLNRQTMQGQGLRLSLYKMESELTIQAKCPKSHNKESQNIIVKLILLSRDCACGADGSFPYRTSKNKKLFDTSQ